MTIIYSVNAIQVYPVNTIKVLGYDKTIRGELFKENVSTATEWCCCNSVICFPVSKPEIQ